MMEERLGIRPVAVQIPIGEEHEFRGVIDLVRMRAILYPDELGQTVVDADIPAEMMELAQQYHKLLIESCRGRQ